MYGQAWPVLNRDFLKVKCDLLHYGKYSGDLNGQCCYGLLV